MNEFKRKCFFCSKSINEKKSMEHIIPNSLLGKLGIKEETITGDKATQYSRIKVPSHAKCNNEFGSEYEDRILDFFDDTDHLYDALVEEESSHLMMYCPSDSVTSIITTWLSKIYYGLFYYDYLKTTNDLWREKCLSIISSDNFNFVKESYKNSFGFQLPSSLYVFKTDNQDTDLITMISPTTILFKIKNITLVLCICDGFLTKNYLNEDSLKNLRDYVEKEDKNNVAFPSYKLALGEILALRSCIPKNPKFVYSQNQIINMSFSTLAENPDEVYKIDLEALKEARAGFFKMLNIR